MGCTERPASKIPRLFPGADAEGGGRPPPPMRRSGSGRSREKKLDPLVDGPRGGGVASVLAGARASLVNPSRPYTPADALRPLFAG
eukprot:COSAG04_NODE_937_length_9318_cov_6.549192_1_plen_85_part_10